MNRELELLGKNIRYKKEHVGNDTYRLYIKKNEIELLENYLTELEQIKNAKPSEALACLDQFINEMTRCLENPKQYVKNYDKEIFYKYKYTFETTIKQALLKAEKLEKAIKCIKNLSAYNIELKEHVFVNKLIYWKDDLMLTGYSDKSQFKVEDYGITWKEVEE